MRRVSGLWQDMIKADWPQSIIYINEAQDAVNCNFNRLGDPIFEEVTSTHPTEWNLCCSSAGHEDKVWPAWAELWAGRVSACRRRWTGSATTTTAPSRAALTPTPT